MITLEIPDMHCAKCVARIGKALDQADITNTISLETKTVTIDGCEQCAQKAIAVLDDLGYSAAVKP